MRTTRIIAPLCAVSMAVLVARASPALAAGAADDAAGIALFNEGKQLAGAGDWEHACPKFAEAQRLHPAAAILLNLAECFEHVNRLASAWGTWKEAEISARNANDAPREQEGMRRSAALVPQLAKLAIVVPPATRVPGLEVRKDGALVGDGQFGSPLPADVGAHTIEASAPGHKAWSTVVRIETNGSSASVEIPALDVLSTPPAGEPAVPFWSTQRIAGASVGAAGAAGTLIGSTIVAGAVEAMANLGGGPIPGAGYLLAKYDAKGSYVFAEAFPVDGPTGNGVYAVATDAASNIFLTGSFTNSVNFGSAPLKDDSFPTEVPFIAQLDASGDAVFSEAFPHVAIGAGYAAVTDAAGNLVIAGYCAATDDFGGGPIGAGNGLNAFVARFDTKGALLTGVGFGGSGDARAQGLGIDAGGNVVIAGPFTGTMSFGGTSLTSSGTDMFVAKLDPSFNVLYAQKVGPGVDVGDPGIMGYPGNIELAVDAAGAAVIAGGFTGTLGIGTTMLVGGSDEDAFVAKLDPMGKPVWTKDLGGPGTQYASAVAIDGAGNVVMASPNAGASGALFVAKINGANGSILWSTSAYDEMMTTVTVHVAVDPVGDISLAGAVSGPLSFPNVQLPAPSTGNASDLYLMALSQ